MEKKFAAPGPPNSVEKPSGEADLRPVADEQNTAKILVVDEEAFVRSMIGATLERQGYDVVSAASGRDALELLMRSTSDLLLTDIVIQD